MMQDESIKIILSYELGEAIKSNLELLVYPEGAPDKPYYYVCKDFSILIM